MTTNTTNLLLEPQDIALQDFVMFALSQDEKTMLIHGLREENGRSNAQIVIYDLETRSILGRFYPSQIIPFGKVSYPEPGIGDDSNFGWVGGKRWFLTKAAPAK